MPLFYGDVRVIQFAFSIILVAERIKDKIASSSYFGFKILK